MSQVSNINTTRIGIHQLIPTCISHLQLKIQLLFLPIPQLLLLCLLLLPLCIILIFLPHAGLQLRQILVQTQNLTEELLLPLRAQNLLLGKHLHSLLEFLKLMCAILWYRMHDHIQRTQLKM